MNDDESFIAAIEANPADDALRLVYADWLEERGDPRADYLRLEVELSRMPDDDPRTGQMRDRRRAVGARLDPAWRAVVGLKYDVVLDDFLPQARLDVIRLLRLATGMGLQEATCVLDREPHLIRHAASRDDAEIVRGIVEFEVGRQLGDPKWNKRIARAVLRPAARD